MKTPHLILLIFSLQYLLLPSCGYRLYRTTELPITSVRIGSVQNRTAEPGLQDIFTRVFTEEMLRAGLTPSAGSDHLLSVTITGYRLNTLSIKDDLSAEYSVEIKADVMLHLPDGTVKEYRGMSSEFMETFVAADDIQSIQSRREVATEKALQDLSQRIIAELIYGTLKE